LIIVHPNYAVYNEHKKQHKEAFMDSYMDLKKLEALVADWLKNNNR
jgi:hypothetical protein